MSITYTYMYIHVYYMCTGVKPLKIQTTKNHSATNSSQYIRGVGHSERIGTKVNPHEEDRVNTSNERAEHI